MKQLEEALQNDDDDDDDDDSDEELEFSDLPATEPAGALVDSDDDDEAGAKPAAKRKAESDMSASPIKRRLAEESLADSDVEETQVEAPSTNGSLATSLQQNNDAESDDETVGSTASQRARRLELPTIGRKKQNESLMFHDGTEESSSDSDDDLFPTKRLHNDQQNAVPLLLVGDSDSEIDE
jgi:hypothetical protein